jgi:hypothetical protein
MITRGRSNSKKASATEKGNIDVIPASMSLTAPPIYFDEKSAIATEKRLEAYTSNETIKATAVLQKKRFLL